MKQLLLERFLIGPKLKVIISDWSTLEHMNNDCYFLKFFLLNRKLSTTGSVTDGDI